MIFGDGSPPSARIRSTTILSVRHRGRVAMGGDGQMTIGQMVVKQNAKKIRRMYNDSILAGFAGGDRRRGE